MSKEVVIDITASPMNTDALTNIRQQNTDTLALITRRQRSFDITERVIRAIVIVGLGAWFYWYLSQCQEDVDGLLVTTLLFFLSLLYAALSLILRSLVSNIAKCVIDPTREQSNKNIAQIAALDESNPESCIDWMALVDSDDTVRAYQDQLHAVGRRPIMAELIAAQDWVNNTERRTLEAAGQEACMRMDAHG